jgi:hypothetical protein
VDSAEPDAGAPGLTGPARAASADAGGPGVPDSDRSGVELPPPASPQQRQAEQPPTTQRPEAHTVSYVFALGQVEPRFPTLGLEQEYRQAVVRQDTANGTDRQTLRAVLSDRSNRYLVRHLCWVFSIGGLETYMLLPRDPADFDLLVDAVRPEASGTDIDVVIGTRGPLAAPDLCGGRMLPVVPFDQLYSFDREALIATIPTPEDLPSGDEDQFRADATELFERIAQMADNAGATDEHRALNFLVVRYPAIYARTAQAHREGAGLTGVAVKPSRLSGLRDVVDVILSYTHRRTDVTERFFVRVDVTEQYPFVVTKLSPYYER